MRPGRQGAAARLLVTGASGFVGAHVRDAVHAGVFGDVEFIALPPGTDLNDGRAVEGAVTAARPDLVLHLAAQSFVPRSFEAPAETFAVNLLGTLNLLQAMKLTGFAGRMVYVSSGDVYGRVEDAQLPVDEDTPAAPRSPYAVSKIAAEQLCLQWHRTEALDVTIARPFNHIGPGQDAVFAIPSIASQVRAIAAGRQPPEIEVGDIDTTRDFTDVRDVVAAYAAMFARGRAGATYVVASGRERRIRDLLAVMCGLAGVEPRIRHDPARMRPAEQRRMVASAARLSNDTGWSPGISLERTLSDILEKVDGKS